MTQFKIMIIVAVIAFGTGWTVRGWYNDAQVKDAQDQAIEDHKDLTVKDEKTIEKAADDTDVIRGEFRDLREEIADENVRDDCTVNPNLIKLWNAASNRAGQGLASGVHDRVPITGRIESNK